MKFKYYILFFAMIQFAGVNLQTIFAGPANPKPFVATQPDQTNITLRVFGDEWYHCFETIDGYTIIKKTEGWWVYAQRNAAGELSPSNVTVGPPLSRSSNELNYIATVGKHLRPTREVIEKLRARNPYGISNYVKEPELRKFSNKTTTWKVLVLLVEFPDLFHSESVQSFVNMFNQEGWEGGIGSTGSFNDYYREVSYGKFGIEADVYGWYMAATSYTYYSWSHPERWTRAREFVANAVDHAEAAGIDFSKYDNDGDGKVEQIIVVHAGHGAAQAGDEQYIWPHKYGLGNLRRNYDGVEINDYTMQEELQYDRHAGIGMYCHEFGHALGLPDLYDTDLSSEGIGSWGEMGAGAWLNWGRTPPHFCAWSKGQLGWINPTQITLSSIYSFKEIEFDSSAVYKIDIPTDDSEYFLVENRQNIGFDTYLPGSGLLIWHIDTDKTTLYPGSNTVNTDENHKGVDLEEADGIDHLDKASNRGDDGDPFPGSSDNRTFDSHSYPNSLDYDGNYSVVAITDISNSDSIVTADVNIDGMAFYTANPRTGHAPLMVNFTDASISFSPITSWVWDFDNDGNVDSELQNPSWTYAEPGHYSVRLNISNDYIATSTTFDDYIWVFDGESALLFNQDEHFGMIPADSSLNPTDAITVEAWINPAGWGSEASGLARVFDKSNFYLYLQKSATVDYTQHSLIFLIKDENNNKSRWNTSANSISLNKWQHIALTYDSNTEEVKIFINGTNQPLTHTGTLSGKIKDNATMDLFIGNGVSKTQAFDGALDEVRLWGIVRTEAEIQANMDHYLNGNESGLLGYWKMNEGNGETLLDSSPNNNDGTVFSSWIDGKPLGEPITGIKEDVSSGIPKTYELFTNYPNPFNPNTTIKFALPVEAKVSIKIFNILGKQVSEILHKKLTAGFHDFNFNASNLSSGVYFYAIYAKGIDGTLFFKTRKMILLR